MLGLFPSDVRSGAWCAAGLVAVFLLLFLVMPVAWVFYTAFVNADGSPTIGHFVAFFSQPLMQEAFFNSLYVAVMSTVFASASFLLAANIVKKALSATIDALTNGVNARLRALLISAAASA